MPSKVNEAKILPRRFELMKKMYLSDKIITRNKRFSILNWFFEQIGNYRNDPFSVTYELLWKTLHDILEIERRNPGERILIKSNAISNLLDAVKNYPLSCSWASTILSSASVFLQASVVNSTLIADVDKLILLLIHTLKIICKIYEGNTSDLQSLKHAKYLANILLDVLDNLPSSSEVEKASIITESLQDLAVFMHIAEKEKELEQLSEKLAKKIIGIIFNPKRKHFETLLASTENKSQMVEPNAFILQFFISLQKLLFNEDELLNSVSVNECCATLSKKLLSTFLMQNKSSLNSLKVIALFFAVAGLDIPILFEAKSCCNPSFKKKMFDSSVFIFGVSNLLDGCTAVPQYFTFMGVPDGYLKPSLWLKGVSATLLTTKFSKNKASWLKCFHSLLMISPSIVEDDILQLIKIAFLNISVHSAESKNQYCELFDVVLQAHSKLHQVPKFFVKLLLALTECITENSGGNLLTNGQLLPRVQESIARCIQELPYGQMIEIWKIFIETFSNLENMHKVFMVSKGFIFFVAQLFSNFLLHAQIFQANIPSNIYSQFTTLIESSCSEVKKITSSLKEIDIKIVSSQRSILLLYYAIGEIKLAYNAYYGKLSEDMLEAHMCEEIFDFSILHDSLDKDYFCSLEAFLSGDDKIISSLVYQLLLQKIKAYLFKETLSDEDTNHIQQCISVVLKHLQESSSACAPWDQDLSNINSDNYGTAYWLMFLRLSPLFLNHLSSRDFYSLCNTAQSVILQDDCFETGAKSLILAYFKNEFFQECKHFQTAFVSAVWQQENLLSSKKRSHEDMEGKENPIDLIFSLLNAYHSKALKYAQRTPKSSKNLGSMWKEIKEISDVLNNILLNESLPRSKLIIKRTNDLVKLLGCLPLDYLLPGNQMKCIIGLSILLFLVPQSCKSDEIASVSKEIAQLLLSILEGIRSIWLFDFISSGPFLKYVMKTVESVINVDYDSNHDWCLQLIERLVSLLVKNMESLCAVESFISELAAKQKYSRVTIITFYAFLKKFSQIIPRPHKEGKYRETVLRMSSITIQSFLKQMEIHFKDVSNNDHTYFVKGYMQIIEMVCGSTDMEQLSGECFNIFSSILEKAMNKVKSSNVDALGDLYLLFISKVCKYSAKLSSFLSKDFISTSWKIILSHLEEKKKRKLEGFSHNQSLKQTFFDDLNSNSCEFCSKNVSLKENYISTWQVICCDKNPLLPLSLNEFEEESLKELSLITSPEESAEVVLNLSKEMFSDSTRGKDMFQMQMSILIFQSLIEANKDKILEPSLNKCTQNFLTNLCILANQACNSVVCQTMVKIPILDFFDFVVKGNKGLPKNVLLLGFDCVGPFSLEVCDNNYELFVKSFNAVWRVVYDLFMHHTSIILPFPAVFLQCVAKLLKSIVKAGAADPLSKCDSDLSQQVQLCAQNMNRLLTVITRHKNEFSKLVPYLLSYYVDTVQHITLNSNVKESILSGLHRILDICSEHSIKTQAVNINSASREVFGNLVKNYRQNKHKAMA